ncbi:MAG: hypothetical protein IJL23_01630 [Alphaproteobacteria bacterium]|nr:hypothetical protein [Alphaproteobacteria bacterium]
MKKIYFIVAIGALIFGAYFYGVNITHAKCREKQSQNNLVEIQNIEQNKRIIHDTVYKTGMRNIRRILHDKYTIAE